MNNHMIYLIGKLEHEERVRSVPCVPEFSGPAITNEPRWLSQQARYLRSALTDGLAMSGERMQGQSDLPGRSNRNEAG
jgi:hypothetical protein